MFERIQVDPKIHFGKLFVRGTLITIENVLELINEGLSFDDIIQDYFPDLVKDDVKECQEFFAAIN